MKRKAWTNEREQNMCKRFHIVKWFDEGGNYMSYTVFKMSTHFNTYGRFWMPDSTLQYHQMREYHLEQWWDPETLRPSHCRFSAKHYLFLWKCPLFSNITLHGQYHSLAHTESFIHLFLLSAESHWWSVRERFILAWLVATLRLDSCKMLKTE